MRRWFPCICAAAMTVAGFSGWMDGEITDFWLGAYCASNAMFAISGYGWAIASEHWRRASEGWGKSNDAYLRELHRQSSIN